MASKKKKAAKKAPPKKAPPKKKAAKKASPKATKARKKKPAPLVKRELAPRGASSATNYRVRMAEVRRMAAHDYITDVDQRSLDYWHSREDRPYHGSVKLLTFRDWAAHDAWNPRRKDFWQELEARVYEARADQLLARKLKEIDERTEERDAMAEYMRPLRDPKTGEMLRHPELREVPAVYSAKGVILRDSYYEPHPHRGLPVLPLEVGRFPEMVKAFIAFDEHLLTMRGEATSRTEVTTRDASRSAAVDPTAAAAVITEDDIHAMSRALLRQRQPELGMGSDYRMADNVDDDEEENVIDV